jgi:membrane protease YdiL (CAAX protease family)
MTIQGILTRWFPSEHPVTIMLRENPSGPLFAMGVLVAVFVAPPAEELFFRVLLQGWLEKIGGTASQGEASPVGGGTPPLQPNVAVDEPMGEPLSGNPDALEPAPVMAPAIVILDSENRSPPRWPILVSAAVFALLHFSHGPDWVPLFFLACGLGYLYRQTHRILPAVTVHFLLNGASMTLLWMEVMFGK